MKPDAPKSGEAVVTGHGAIYFREIDWPGERSGGPEEGNLRIDFHTVEDHCEIPKIARMPLKLTEAEEIVEKLQRMIARIKVREEAYRGQHDRQDPPPPTNHIPI